MIRTKDLDPLAFRRGLRRRGTPAERRLWSLLRGRRLAGRKFRRQHAIGHHVVDFYCPAERLAIELDGGVHDDPLRWEYDTGRDAALAAAGVRVLHIPNEALTQQPEAVAEWIALHFRVQPGPPPPSPLLPEEGEE